MTYRSKAEKEFANVLADAKIKFEYEPNRIPYVISKTYLPDFYLVDYGFYIEFKGYFKPSDRTKHKLIKEQHPLIDIRFVFMDANKKLNKTSKTSYGFWCDQHGFKWAENKIPDEWLTKKKKVDCNNINKEDEQWNEEKKKIISSDKRRIPFDIEHSYLYLSYQTFYFRFRWPPDVRGIVGQREKIKSLRTHDLFEARLKRDELLTKCKLLVHKVRTNDKTRRTKENIRSI
jgi:sulfur relay (sulfurtransferase) DsrC/TusE family protein